MEESKDESRIGRFCITKKWLAIWAVSCIIVVYACYLIRPNVFYENEFSVLINAMNVISYVLAIGFPVFFSASITFGTLDAKKHIFILFKSGKNSREVFLRCLIETYSLVIVLCAVLTSLLFLEPLLVGTTFNLPTGKGFLIYLPSVLIATLVVSLLLASVGVFLVIVTEDIIVSTSIGCVLTTGLAALVGVNSQVLWQSVTKGIAMLSPSNLARIFAGTISNYNPTTFSSYSYFGFSATLPSILLVLGLFGAIAFIGLIASNRIFLHDTSHWTIERGESRLEIWGCGLDSQEVYEKTRRRQKRGRLILIGLVIMMLSIATTGTTFYTNSTIEATTTYFYQSPQGGEVINLGEWNTFSCNIQSGQDGQLAILHFEFYFESWGNCPDQLCLYYGMLSMLPSNFLILNEASQRSLCHSINATQGELGGIGTADGDLVAGAYTYVLKIVAAQNNTISGYLQCSITLVQRPMF